MEDGILRNKDPTHDNWLFCHSDNFQENTLESGAEYTFSA